MGYEEIMQKVIALPQNDTTKFVLSLLAKLIADEKVHIKMFKEWLAENKD
ncbi:MAG: hypothetical protein LBF15_05475 [Candidatus Peribacteria bacterium]|jgi:rubrerythrin|nr:hypothetical protein [Candidatus Peribacteria bacterium]